MNIEKFRALPNIKELYWRAGCSPGDELDIAILKVVLYIIENLDKVSSYL